MQKYITSILLVAGTCIGGGTIALPMVLAKLGIIPSIIIMLLTWLVTYYTSLVSVELNLQSERGLSLGQLGRVFSGKIAAAVGEISVKLLSYALLAVFIYGGASAVQKLLEVYLHCSVSNFAVETWITVSTVILLLFPLEIISKINNIAFIVFAAIFLILIGTITGFIDYKNMPWMVEPSSYNIASVMSVVFTSFGYQVIFHTLRDYCGKNVKMQQRIFFYGSLIPAVVYILWTSCSLSTIFASNPQFFAQMVAGKVDVGDLVLELSAISGCTYFRILIWWMSIFAIFTSILGVGIGLAESVNISLGKTSLSSWGRKIVAAIITVIPAYIIAAVVPNAFIKILGFAGAILVVIAVWLPVYLFLNANLKTQYTAALKKWPLILCTIIGLAITVIELFMH